MVEPNGIWGKVKKNLKDAIDAVTDETTELIVIPFANDKEFNPSLPLDNCCMVEATAVGKRRLKEYIDNLPTPTKSTMTYHKIPLQDFVEYRIDRSKKTYMFLMTDGIDEEKGNTFNEMVKHWNKYTGVKNENDISDVYGIYVMLDDVSEYSEYEKNKYNARKRLIDSVDYFWQVETADININEITLTDKIVYNIRNEEESVRINIRGIENVKSGNSLSFDLDAPQGAPFEIKKVERMGDQLIAHISPKEGVNVNSLAESLVYTIKAEMTGASDDMTLFFTDKIKLTCISKKENSVTIKHTRATQAQSRSTWDKIRSAIGIDVDRSASFGAVHYHPSFLWSPESLTPVVDTIYFEFSEDAKLNDLVCAEFQFVDNKGVPYGDDVLKIYEGDDDEPLPNNTLSISNKDCEKELKFVFSPKAENGKYQGYFRLVDHYALHRVDHYFLNQGESKVLTGNQTDQKSQVNIFQWTLHYKKHCNPLLRNILLLIFLLCLIAFLVWLTFYLKKQLAPKFHKDWSLAFDSANNIYFCQKMMFDDKCIVESPPSSTIYTYMLQNEYINKIVIARNVDNKVVGDKWNGDIIYLACDFKQYDIDSIVVRPLSNSISIEVTFINSEKQTITLYYKDDMVGKTEDKPICDGLCIYLWRNNKFGILN